MSLMQLVFVRVCKQSWYRLWQHFAIILELMWSIHLAPLWTAHVLLYWERTKGAKLTEHEGNLLKTEYNLKAIMYSAYGTHHRLTRQIDEIKSLMACEEYMKWITIVPVVTWCRKVDMPLSGPMLTYSPLDSKERMILWLQNFSDQIVLLNCCSFVHASVS